MQANQHHPTASLELIYEKYAALMYGCIYKLVPQKETADKILSEVFIDLYKNEDANNFILKDSMWFLKHAMKAAFDFIKRGPMAKELPAIVVQQLSELKTAKYLPIKNRQMPIK